MRPSKQTHAATSTIFPTATHSDSPVSRVVRADATTISARVGTSATLLTNDPGSGSDGQLAISISVRVGIGVPVGLALLEGRFCLLRCRSRNLRPLSGRWQEDRENACRLSGQWDKQSTGG